MLQGQTFLPAHHTSEGGQWSDPQATLLDAAGEGSVEPALPLSRTRTVLPGAQPGSMCWW